MAGNSMNITDYLTGIALILNRDLLRPPVFQNASPHLLLQTAELRSLADPSLLSDRNLP